MKKRKISKNPLIRAIIFDIGGVLALGKDLGQIGSSKGVHEKIAQSLGVSLDQWFDTIGEKYEKTITGEIKEKEFLNYLSITFHKSSKFIKNLFLKNYKSNYKQNTRLYEFAFKLKNKGYKISVLSDQHPFSLEAVVPKNKIKHFNPIIISCKVGFRKPNPKIYLLVLKKLNLKPQETVFIDNQLWNLKPAKKLGINTLLFKTNKQLFKQLEKLGVKV